MGICSPNAVRMADTSPCVHRTFGVPVLSKSSMNSRVLFCSAASFSFGVSP